METPEQCHGNGADVNSDRGPSIKRLFVGETLGDERNGASGFYLKESLVINLVCYLHRVKIAARKVH